MCACVRVHVCVCACMHAHKRVHTHTHSVYVCVCDIFRGTEKQVVAYDYAERLANGINETQVCKNTLPMKSN